MAELGHVVGSAVFFGVLGVMAIYRVEIIVSELARGLNPPSRGLRPRGRSD